MAGQTANQIVVKVVAALGVVVGAGLGASALFGTGERVLLAVGVAMAVVSVLIFRNAHRLAPPPPEEPRDGA